jgi:hypothetical protein
VDTVSKVAIAIVSLAIIATVAVNGVNASKVVGSVTTGFSNSLSAAEKG